MESLLNQIEDHSRVWIYQADRPLTEKEVAEIQASGNDFIDTWAAHGKKLNAGALVLHRYFVVLFADESQVIASGCSIDSSVQWVRETGNKYGIDFFNRLNIVYVNEQNEPVLCSPAEFESLASQGKIGPETRVFNNMAYTGAEIKSGWLCPAAQGWQARYLNLSNPI